jgi:hypothetical protein
MAALPNVEWYRTSKGKPLLCIDNYLFENAGKGKTAGVTYWKCSTKDAICEAKAKTRDRNLESLIGVVNPPHHGHMNDEIRLRSLQLLVCTLR